MNSGPSGKTKTKLKSGQQKKMQHMARQALFNSKLHKDLIQRRLQRGRWPRKHFKFDLIEVFGGTSMVSIRGATLWRLRVMQPVDIRFGIDLRKRSIRRWLMRTLETANPRLAIVEYGPYFKPTATIWGVKTSWLSG